MKNGYERLFHGVREGENFRYNLQFENNGSILDVSRIVDFYDDIYLGKEKSPERTIQEIRQFAKEHFDMEIMMKNVTDYLCGDENN
jgi:hypothetical protein